MKDVESVVIFCGGKGSRLSEVTGSLVPKPMVKIGHYPIIWHLIKRFRKCMECFSERHQWNGIMYWLFTSSYFFANCGLAKRLHDEGQSGWCN